MPDAPNQRHVDISPSILNSDLTRLRESLELLTAAEVDWVHLDVMDGQFVPNISIGIPVVASVRAATQLPLDVHLMIAQPERYLPEFIGAGANSITVHYEATPHQHRALQTIQAAGVRAGLAINIGTPIVAVADLLPVCDLVLVMSINPGFGGQAFQPITLRRLRQLRDIIERDGYATQMQVDGGVSARNAAEIVAAGADNLVAGTAVFGHTGGVVTAVRELRAAADAGAASPPGPPPRG
jgi:ribulose-phosphate 3-epimerase